MSNLAINIDVENKDWDVDLESLKKAAILALESENISNTEITILLSDDKRIRELNSEFRGKDKPTDILSFPAGEEGYLGDIILALETIKKDNEDSKLEFYEHLSHLIIHGVLHLLGYNHENEEEAEIMERKEINILNKLNIINPYN